MKIPEKLKVINVGAKTFHDSLEVQEASAVHVDWRPPAGGDEEMADLLDELEDL